MAAVSSRAATRTAKLSARTAVHWQATSVVSGSNLNCMLLLYAILTTVLSQHRDSESLDVHSGSMSRFRLAPPCPPPCRHPPHWHPRLLAAESCHARDACGAQPQQVAPDLPELRVGGIVDRRQYRLGQDEPELEVAAACGGEASRTFDFGAAACRAGGPRQHQLRRVPAGF